MIRFDDYFIDYELHMDYPSNEIMIEDFLRFVDMFLDHVFESRKADTEEDPYIFRGHGITALNHIKGGLRRSDTAFSRLYRRFSIGDYQLLAIILAVAADCRMDYSRRFARYMEDNEFWANVGLLNTLYESIGGVNRDACEGELLDPDNLISRLFFQFSDSVYVSRTVAERLPNQLLSIKLKPVALWYLKTGASSISDNDNGVVNYIASKEICRELFSDRAELLENASDLVLLLGEDALLKEELVISYAGKLKRDVLSVEMDYFTSIDRSELETCFDRILYEIIDASPVLYCKNVSEKVCNTYEITEFISFLRNNMPGVQIIFDISERLESGIFKDSDLRIIKLLSRSEQEMIWEDVLRLFNADASLDPNELASCYHLSFSDIWKVVARAVALEKSESLKRDTLVRVMLEESVGSFGNLATRIESGFEWEDLQLAKDQLATIRLACNRYKYRHKVSKMCNVKSDNVYGKGVSILFYGPPGTGKTMAAQIIAKEVGLPLYRVDISQLVSKYIGETQKNLSKVFDEADRKNVVLFFDEADAIFSKRNTEVNSSNDKHANMETAFLLQKIEAYNGFVILATNIARNFDVAFIRRITYAVKFEEPDESTRLLLWDSFIPDDFPRDEEIDTKYFAEHFRLSGSNIKAIVTGAIYIAAIEGQGLTNRHIIKSMKQENNKIGKMFVEQDLGPYQLYYLD